MCLVEPANGFEGGWLSVLRALGVRAGVALVLVAVGVFGSSASAFARGAHPFIQGGTVAKIGRASCRERV